jgi:branched-chain amino acid transport system substrate-binding protein
MVFYNPQSPYSRSLRDQFDVSIRATGGRIGKSIDLCQVAFNAGDILEKARQQGTTAIALFPDGRFCAASYPNVLTTIRANNRRYPMVASWVLSRADTLESVGEHIVGKLVFATPWHRLSSTNSNFLKEAEVQWGQATLHGEGINTGTATTYDATRALIHALVHPSQPNTRVGVQQVLADPDFEAQGATGPIRFLGGDRQEPVQVLLKVVPSQGCNHYQYSFVPVNYPLAKEGILNCHTHSGGSMD